MGSGYRVLPSATIANDCPWRCIGWASGLMFMNRTRARSPRRSTSGSVFGYTLRLMVQRSLPIMPPLRTRSNVWVAPVGVGRIGRPRPRP